MALVVNIGVGHREQHEFAQSSTALLLPTFRPQWTSQQFALKLNLGNAISRLSMQDIHLYKISRTNHK